MWFRQGVDKVLAQIRALYSDEQPRDEKGQWTGTLYHGTISDGVKSIRAHGLLAKHSGKFYAELSKTGHVYVTSDKELAIHYAIEAASRFSIEGAYGTPDAVPVVLEVHIPKSAHSKLSIDEKEDIARKGTGVKFRGDIKPAWIKGIARVTQTVHETPHVNGTIEQAKAWVEKNKETRGHMDLNDPRDRQAMLFWSGTPGTKTVTSKIGKFKVFASGEEEFSIFYVPWVVEENALRAAEFNPDQPRDEHGMWTDGGEVQVGITSFGGQQGADKTAHDVKQSMRSFESRLKAVPGVHDVKIAPGTGIFFGQTEPTWVVSFKGDTPEARKLLAETGQKHNQDAVLVMKAGDTDASVEFTFAQKVSNNRAQGLARELSRHDIVGGTWYLNDAGQSVLRMASVQAWGGDKAQHIAATEKLLSSLHGQGVKVTSSVRNISTEVIERKHYAGILKGASYGTRRGIGRAEEAVLGRRIGARADGLSRAAAAARRGRSRGDVRENRTEDRAETRRQAARFEALAVGGGESPLHDVADSYIPTFKSFVKNALKRARRRVDPVELEAAYRAKDPKRILAALDIPIDLSRMPYVNVMAKAGNLVAPDFVKQAPRTAEFNPDQPRDEKGQWAGSTEPFSLPSGYVEDGLNTEHPDIAAHIEKYVYDNKGAAIYAALREDDYASYSADLQRLLKSVYGDRLIAVTRKEGYAGGKGTGVGPYLSVSTSPSWKGTRYYISREDVVLAGHEAEGELVVKREGLKTQPRTASVAELRDLKITPIDKMAFSMQFDVTNENALAWAREHAGELVTAISEGQRAVINDLIVRMFDEGISVRDAMPILKNIVGLNDMQAGAVSNAYNVLATSEPGDRVEIGSKTVTVPDDGDFDDILSGYSERLLDDRAEMIARTETMSAANAGTAEMWDQAVEEGLLTGNEYKQWIATDDEKTCPECGELDGETVPLDEDFSIGDDPPAHPNCRCTMGIVDAPRAASAFVVAAEFNEDQHPRDEKGRWTFIDTGDSLAGERDANFKESNARVKDAMLRMRAVHAQLIESNKTFEVASRSYNALQSAPVPFDPASEAAHASAVSAADEARAHADQNVALAYRDMEQATNALKIAVVERSIVPIATEMDYPMDRIRVTTEAGSFTLDGQQHTEAGHYSPALDEIVVRAGSLTDYSFFRDDPSKTSVSMGAGATLQAQELAAHEIAHAQYTWALKQHERETDQLKDIFNAEYTARRNGEVPPTDYFKPKSGMVREEKWDELAQRFPVAALFGDTWGNPYMNRSLHDVRQTLEKEDGVSAYSRMWWEHYNNDTLRKGGWPQDSALNETLAEVARIDRFTPKKETVTTVGMDGVATQHKGDKPPSELWLKLSRGISTAYKTAHRNRGGK